MKRWVWHLLLFVVAYVVTLIATLPAAWVVHWAEPALAQLPQKPVLQGVDGSLWAGRAAQATVRGVALGGVQWTLSPWSLLIGRVTADVRLNNADGYLAGKVSSSFAGGGMQLRGVTGQLPASLMKSAVPALPITPAGSLAVNLEEMVVDGARLQSLQGRVVWNKGGITAPLALEFGDLAAEFNSTESGISGIIKDSGGPLQLAAELKLGADGSYTLAGKSAARPGAAPALTTSLSLLGQPDGQGMIPFRFNGRL